MSTTELPFGETHARSGDPDTSKAAAFAAEDLAAAHCSLIATVINQHRCTGATAAEISQALNGQLTVHEIGKRLPDLERQGVAHPCPLERVSALSGRKQRVWLPGRDPKPKPKALSLTERVAALEARIADLETEVAR